MTLLNLSKVPVGLSQNVLLLPNRVLEVDQPV